MKKLNMLTVPLVILAFSLAPIIQAAPSPDAGPTRLTANEAPRPDGGPVSLATNEKISPVGEQMPVISIHSTDNVTRGKIGSFVLNMSPALMLGGMYINFSVSGTAIPGVDYVALVSPTYIGQSGYGVIQVQTLPDPRASAIRQAYSVVITLKDGAGYSVGSPSSATMWIKP